MVLGVLRPNLGPRCTKDWSTVGVGVRVGVGRVAGSECWSGRVLREGNGRRCANAAARMVQYLHKIYRIAGNIGGN